MNYLIQLPGRHVYPDTPMLREKESMFEYDPETGRIFDYREKKVVEEGRQPEPEPQPADEAESLKSEHKELFGKAPHPHMSLDKLKAKIEQARM